MGFGNHVSLDEVLKNPVWQELSGDKNLLRDYAAAVFSRLEGETGMPLYFGQPEYDRISGRMVALGSEKQGSLMNIANQIVFELGKVIGKER